MHLTHRSRIPRSDDRYRLQEDDRRRAYDSATSVRDRFPRVSELVVRVTFIDMQRFGTYSSLMHSVSPAAKAFFAIACPRTLCLDGGFDLDAAIAKLLRSGGQVSTGSAECAGNVQRPLPGGRTCLLQMRYDVHVEYVRSTRRT